MKLPLHLLVLFFIAFKSLFLFSQNVERLRESFYHLKTDGGVTQNSITCFAQDSIGKMWMGTKDGLLCHDTKKFTIYKHESDNINSITDNFVTRLLVQDDGTLWVGTQKGIQVYHSDTDDFHEVLPDSISHFIVGKILQDSKGYIWILSILERNIIRYNPKTKQYKIFHFDDDTIDFNLKFIDMVLVDDDTFYISTNTEYILKFTAKNDLFQKIFLLTKDEISKMPLDNKYYGNVLYDHEKYLWILTHAGFVIRYKPLTGEIKKIVFRNKFPKGRKHYYAMDILEDRDYNIWIGTWFDGLYKIHRDRKTIKHILPERDNPNSLSNNIITTIYEDNAGYLWFSTEFTGINILKRNRKFFVQSYEENNNHSLPPVPYLAITRDSTNRVWVGTDAGGLVYFDREKKIVKKIDSKKFDNAMRFFYIQKDKNDLLWLGTEKGLFHFNQYTGKIKQYTYQKGDYNSLSSHNIFSIALEHDNNIWIGTFFKGVNKLNPKTEKNIRFLHDKENPNSLSNDYVGDVLCDSKDNIWLATLDGLNKFNKKTGNFTIYKNIPSDSTSISFNKINCLYEQENTLWVATEGGGLNAYDYNSKKFRHYTKRDGIPDVNIRSVTGDLHGDIWFSTTRNIVKLNPKTNKITIFNDSDGLQNSLYIRDYGRQKLEFLEHSVYRDTDGFLYFGGISGLFIFHPDSLKYNNFKPPVRINSFKINGKLLPLQENKEIVLKHDENQLDFDLVAYNYIQPKKNQYAHYMEPIEKDWIFDGNNGKVSYYNLKSGNYKFHYKASNNDDVWNDNITPLLITIAPPFYQTTWFYLLNIFFIALVILVFIYYKWYIKRQLQKQKEQLRYKTSNLDKKECDLINQKLLSVLEKEKLYLEVDLTLNKLAHTLNTKPHYLSQVINQYHKRNFNDFLNTYRIEYAKHLLIKTDLKIESIAYDSGFSAISTFNVSFKKIVGITPSQFRKKSH